ncbi:MAG: gamma-glutamyl-gamma-aminobutyrate hydrolase family protein [Desulfobacterales bacterium]|nr:gamma-glutamyl-gamma-aminobutyrate hydrolase family protein [Desulfobacterales bacterium]
MIESNAVPLIGITTYGRNKADHYTIPAKHIYAVQRAEGIPVAIPPGEPRPDILLEMIDGLIFCGGGDIGPGLYNGTLHEAIYMVDEERDKGELDLAKRVIESGKPTFAICRGMHVINVSLGGSLYEDLPDMVGNQVQHRLPPREPVAHLVTIKPGTRLMQILNKNEISPESWHHQGIKKLAPGLIVSATAPDNVIEGIEMSSHPWLLGVQWHPELTADTDKEQQSLYNDFVKAAKINKKTKK